MSLVKFNNIKVSGLTAAIPSHCVDNMEYVSIYGEEETRKTIENIGIEKHYKTSRRQTAGDLAYAACDNLLKKKCIDASEIGALLYLTSSPDYMIPATAFVLHKRLGLAEDCFAFDMNLSCAAFVYGLQVAGSLLQGMKKKYILLVDGHAPKHLDVQDRINPDHSSLMMFGDAATAALIERTEEENNISVELYANGNDFKMLCTLGGCRCPDVSRELYIGKDGKEHSMYDARMDGVGVFFFAISTIPKAMLKFAESEGTEIGKYDRYFLHQANKKIITQLIKKTKIPADRTHISLDRYGNTSGCSIPLGIVDYYGNQDRSATEKVFLCGYGAGMAWGVAAIDICANEVFPVEICDDIYEDGELLEE